jgi:HNH endonuclease
MRPIQKPACPTIGGVAKTVKNFHQWKSDLEKAIGMFCTYCGMRLNNSPQVEHVVPQKPKAGRPAGGPLAWDNVVFACAPCNGKAGKSNKDYNETDHYMPEKHNTLLPFKYPASTSSGHQTVAEADGLSAAQQIKASATIGVFSFKKIDNQRGDKFDFRSSERWQAKKAAEASYKIYVTAKDSPTYHADAAAECVAAQAVSAGFFQLWVEQFINEPEVLKKLIHQDYHPGTHQASFDPITGKPIGRNPSNSVDPF